MGGYSMYDSKGSMEISEGGGSKKRGVFLSLPVLIATILAVAISIVAVGLIVHFTAPKCLDCKPTVPPKTEATTVPTMPATVTTAAPPPLDVRLPTDVKPIHYSLTMAPYIYEQTPKAFYFTGSVKILISVLKSTNNFKLHVNKINITGLQVQDDNETNVEILSYIEDTQRQWLSVTVKEPLRAGINYTVSISRFRGPLKADLRGFYLSSYTENGSTKYLATTQMQPTDARKAFPCFDEPAFKATFDVSLVRRQDFKSISNMPSKGLHNVSAAEWFNNTVTGTYVREDFESTPNMSTYLIAFIVSQLEQQNTTIQGRQYSNWVRPEFANLTGYALEAVVNITEYFERYFNVAYPLPKTDQAAVPDFDAGAMENWGLIIYRERLLVFDPTRDRTASKQSIADVISHELAHMWFGNLVTPLWWDDLWLNEGFASFVENLGVDNMHPDWDVDAQFVVGSQGTAFEVDSKGASHPIYISVNHPDEINEIFDSITYSKGSTVLRMLFESIGGEVFRLGVSNYLKKNSYTNTFHTDLYRSLTEQANATGKNIDVGAVMDTWITQMGHPVVNCSRENADKLLLTQQHFLSDPSQKPDPRYPSPFNFTWIVPISMATNENSSSWNRKEMSQFVQWMRNKSQNFSISSTSSWYFLNLRSTGFYRVNYDTENWNALISQLLTNHTVFTPHDRARLIDDSFTLASAGYINYSIPLRMIQYLKNETHLVPWKSALSKLSYIHSMLHRQSPEYGPFSAYVRTLLTPIYSRIGLEPNGTMSHQGRLQHELIVSSACLYGVRQCELDARLMFERLVANFTSLIVPDIRRRVVCEGVATTFVVIWDKLFSELKSVEHPGIQNDLMRGLACSSEPWILNRYLTYALDDTKIRRQDATTVFASVSGNPSGLQIVWDFLRNRWDYIQKQMSGSFTTAYFVSNLGAFNSEQKLREMEQFKEDNWNNLGTAARAMDLAIENVKINVLWMSKHLPDVSKWLESNTVNADALYY